MKQIIYASLLLSSASALAVTVANCPAKIKVSYSQLKIKDNDTILKDYVENRHYDLDEDDTTEMQTVLTRARAIDIVERTFSKTRARGGVCIYDGPNRNSEEKIQIYSLNGKDRLYIQTDIGPRGIVLRTFAKLESLSPTAITVKSDYASLALGIPRAPYTSYSAGGDMQFIGEADQISAEVVP